MYIVRRVYKVKPGTYRKAAELLTQIAKKYEDAGQRTQSRIYWSGGTVPGPKDTVYMDWAEEQLRSPYRTGNIIPNFGDLTTQLREIQEESHIEFYEMFSPK